MEDRCRCREELPLQFRAYHPSVEVSTQLLSVAPQNNKGGFLTRPRTSLKEL